MVAIKTSLGCFGLENPPILAVGIRGFMGKTGQQSAPLRPRLKATAKS